MRNLLFGHLEDCSTPQYFCFSVRCEVCGEYWYSSSIPFSKAAQAAQHREKKELYDAIYQREKERAFMTPSISGRRSGPSWQPDRKPGNGSANVLSAGGWSVMPVFSSAMRWTCAGSALLA